MRNSSLVELLCAENVSGLKSITEAMVVAERLRGRGAFYCERSQTVRTGGRNRRENAGISSVEGCENQPGRKPKVS